MSSAPNALRASLDAASNPASSSASSRTNRMPLPPPPAAALRNTGYPSRAASGRACTWSASGRVLPGTIGTPAACMRRRASVLSPMARMAAAGGPTKLSPACTTASANGARSERKPYPGWIAWHSVACAALISLPPFRYDSAAGPGPMGTAMCAARTWGESRSGSEYTATASSPSSWQARMIRRAISPRLATRTRLKGAIGCQPSAVSMLPDPADSRSQKADGASPTTARNLTGQPERCEGLAQRRRRAGRPPVQRQGRRCPRVVVVEREAQRREDEVARWDAVGLEMGPGDPHEGPRGPADALSGLGRPVERHTHAHGASLHELGDQPVGVEPVAQLQVGGDAGPQQRVRAPRRERHDQDVRAQATSEPHVPGGVGIGLVRGEQHSPRGACAQQVLAQLLQDRGQLEVEGDRPPLLGTDVDPLHLPREPRPRAPRADAQYSGTVPVGGRARRREQLPRAAERVLRGVEQGAQGDAVLQHSVGPSVRVVSELQVQATEQQPGAPVARVAR